MNTNDAIVMLRVRLIEKFPNQIDNLKIKVGKEYVWGWSLYYQDIRPDHFLVGHGPVLINKNTKEIQETGSAYSEEYHVERYEFKIGVRDKYKVEIRKYEKSDTHFRYLIEKTGITCPQLIKMPMVLFRGSGDQCSGISKKLKDIGLEVAVSEDFEVA